MSSRVIWKTLPPKAGDITYGSLQMNVKHIRWTIPSPGTVAVYTIWWGDKEKCIFWPKEEHKNDEKNTAHLFNICTRPELFLRYLEYHQQLKFVICKKDKIIGRSVFYHLPRIYEDKHFDDYLPIYDNNSDVVGDLLICFKLNFFPQNTDLNTNPHNSLLENDPNTNNLASYSPKKQKPKNKVLGQKQADFEPRSPIQKYNDTCEEMLNFLKHKEKNLFRFDVSGPYSTDESDCDKPTPRTYKRDPIRYELIRTRQTRKLVEYLTGIEMTEEDEKRALRTLRNTSPSPSLINIAEAGAINNKLDENRSKKYATGDSTSLSGVSSENSLQHLLSSRNIRQPDPSVRSSHANVPSILHSKTQDFSYKTPVADPNLPIKSGNRKISKFNYYRITLGRIIFNSDGLRRLHGSGHIKGNNENNCPPGNYIIQYKISRVEPKFPLEKKETFKHLSKKILANAVIFGEYDIHKIKDPRSADLITEFKISSQFLNQRLPFALGETESLVIKSSMKLSLPIKSVTGLTLGKLDVQLDVADHIKNLPPAETFPESCKEEIDELILKSSFDSFESKTNSSKYLTLKAMLRNVMNQEKIKNASSLQNSSLVGSFCSLSKDFSEVPVTPGVNLLEHYSSWTDPHSDSSLETSLFVDSFDKKPVANKSCPDLDQKNGSNNSNIERKFCTDGSESLEPVQKLAPTSNRSSKIQRYDIKTHEFYFKIKILPNFEQCSVNFAFPECTADESGKVEVKWAIASVLTDVYRPFFISLPYGIPLKKYLDSLRKSSLTFYFKQRKTFAKACLHLDKLYPLEALFQSSCSKSSLSKTFIVPLIQTNKSFTSLQCEISIEYSNRVNRFTNEQNEHSNHLERYCSDGQSNSKIMEKELEVSNSDLIENECEDLGKKSEQLIENPIGSSLSPDLNMTYSINASKDSADLSEEARCDYVQKMKLEPTSSPLLLKGGCDLSVDQAMKTLAEEEDNLSIIFDSKECKNDYIPHSSNNVSSLPPKSNVSVRSKVRPDTSENLSPDVLESYCNHNPDKVKHSSNVSNHPIIESTSDCLKIRSLSSKVSDSKYLTTEVNIKSSGYQAKALNLPKQIPKKIENSTVSSTSDIILKSQAPQNNTTNLVESPVKSSSKEVLNHEHSNNMNGSNPAPQNVNCPVNDIDLKSDLVQLDLEDDEIQVLGVYSSRETERMTESSNFQSVLPASEKSFSTPGNYSSYPGTTHNLAEESKRDSGFTEKTSLNASKSFSSENKSFYLAENTPIYLPPMDDFGITFKNQNQDKCFLAHIAIVRCLNLPHVKLEEREELTNPTTYITFRNCFNQLHSTGTVVEDQIPEYDSRHKAWLSAELLRNPEERLIFQVWCKKYQNEWTGPDCERDNSLGFAFLDMSILLYGFPYAGGWLNIVTPSGKCNGQIQVLVKPLQDLSNIKNLSPENLLCDPSSFINHLQPFYYYRNLAFNSQVSAKEALNQNMKELQETISGLQLSHKNRLSAQNKDLNLKDSKSNKQFKDSKRNNNTDDLYEQNEMLHMLNSGKVLNPPLVKEATIYKKNDLEDSNKEGCKKKITDYFHSLRKKSRKKKILSASGDENPASFTSDSNSNDSYYKTLKNKIKNKNDRSFVSESKKSVQNDGKSTTCSSNCLLMRSLSLKLKKPQKNKKCRNALLQSLPSYQNVAGTKNTDMNQDLDILHQKFSKLALSKSNTLYHSL